MLFKKINFYLFGPTYMGILKNVDNSQKSTLNWLKNDINSLGLMCKLIFVVKTVELENIAKILNIFG